MARLKPLWLSLPDLSQRMRRARSVAVAADFDGTLAPIADRPEMVELSGRARRALHRVSRLPHAAVGVLSGRTLDDLCARVGLKGIYYSGSAGLETQEPEGRRRLHMPPGQGLPDSLREVLEAWCKRFPGAWLEEKNHSYSLHYRGVPGRFQPAFGAGVRRRIAPVRGQARLVHGKKVFEVLPQVPWDKGAALERWLRTHRTSLAFYLGDDTHDEPAFMRVRKRHGISVVVGRPASRAEFVVTSPDDVVWFLEWLGREWRERIGAGNEMEPVLAEVAQA